MVRSLSHGRLLAPFEMDHLAGMDVVEPRNKMEQEQAEADFLLAQLEAPEAAFADTVIEEHQEAPLEHMTRELVSIEGELLMADIGWACYRSKDLTERDARHLLKMLTDVRLFLTNEVKPR